MPIYRNQNTSGNGCLFTALGMLLLLGAIITGAAYFIHSADIRAFKEDGKELVAAVYGTQKVSSAGVGEGGLSRVNDLICVTSDVLPEIDRPICTDRFVSDEMAAMLSPGTAVRIYYLEETHEVLLEDAILYRESSIFFSYTHLILLGAAVLLLAMGRYKGRGRDRDLHQ